MAAHDSLNLTKSCADVHAYWNYSFVFFLVQREKEELRDMDNVEIIILAKKIFFNNILVQYLTYRHVLCCKIIESHNNVKLKV